MKLILINHSNLELWKQLCLIKNNLNVIPKNGEFYTS